MTIIQIKLNGNDLAADLDLRGGDPQSHNRGASENAVFASGGFIRSISMNAARTMQYLLDFDHKLNERAPDGFRRVQYVEQPTARDLASNRQNVMFKRQSCVPS